MAFRLKMPQSLQVDEEEPDRTLESDLRDYGLDETTKESIRELDRNMPNITGNIKHIEESLSRSIKRPESRKLFSRFSDIALKFWNPASGFEVDVYVSKIEPDKYLKLYVAEERSFAVAKSEFLFEVYYQNKAFELNGICNFISPRIYEYGYFVDHTRYCLYMIMDFIPEDNMSNAQCKSITQSILAVDDCLQKHNISHNDIAPRNVRVREVDGEYVPILFDYGEARNKQNSIPNPWRCLSDPVASGAARATSEQVLTKFDILDRVSDAKLSMPSVDVWEANFGKGGAGTTKCNLTTRTISRHTNKRNKNKNNKRKTRKHKKRIHSRKKKIYAK